MWRLLCRFLSILKLQKIGRDRLATIVRENSLSVRWPKQRKYQTTYSGHHYAVQPNLLHEKKAIKPNDNEIWVADITYILVSSCAAYLFLITDAFSRKIVGFHVAQTLHAEGAIEALKMALVEHGNPQGVIHHTDRGVQYCCHDFLDEIRFWHLRSSK